MKTRTNRNPALQAKRSASFFNKGGADSFFQRSAQSAPPIQMDGQPWPFNGKVENNSDFTVTVWDDTNDCHSIGPQSESDWFDDDVDFIRSPASGDWFKIGANTVEVGEDGRVSGFSRRATQEEIDSFLQC